MRLLFALTHAGLFRNFDSTLRELVARGHEVHVSFDSARYPSDAFAALEAASPGLTSGLSPAVAEDRWAVLGRQVRAASDYVRYLDPRYAGAPKLRERARRQVAPWAAPLLRPGADLRAADRRLRALERALPLSAPHVAFLRERRPDVLAVSSLFGSAAQLELLRAARALGIPSVHAVASWDNLTNKGLIRELPDRVLVWNDVQREEAVELHGVPSDRVVVTGAQNFDEWFARTATATPEAFKRRMGLPEDRPYVLYLGSSSFIAPDEAEFGREWLAALRADPRLAEVGVLLRPHPQNARQWDRPELTADPRVAIWPPPGLTPQQTGKADWSREDFYDSMAHAAAVVGINTTAQIESGVLGRPVHTVLDPRFAQTQGGTLHFHHLCSVNGGLLHVARTLPEHLDQLAASVERDGAPDPRSRAFVSAFVRPHGLDRPATPVVVDALEAAARVRPSPPPAPARRPPAAAPLAAVAVATTRAGRALGPKGPRRALAKRARRWAKRIRRLRPAR